jgi:chemotaxis protein methyltransferase CheR
MQKVVLEKQTFQKFAKLVYEKCGIHLGEKKQALVQARVGKRMRALSIERYVDYYDFVEQDSSGKELVSLLDAITTNVTHFFREDRHFKLLGLLLRQWEDAGQTRFRIWSAASSSGEEPYSIAMTVLENLQNPRDTKILATDISTRLVEKARQGIYEQHSMETVPVNYQARYFEALRGNDPVSYRVVPAVRDMVTFGRINLAKSPFPLKGPLDIVFCRNVMIYFDDTVRTTLLSNICQLLKPQGYLMVGHAESLTGGSYNFKRVEPSVYIKP